MSINLIDTHIDKLIDDFYNNVIQKDKSLSKIQKEKNFIKYQKDINDIFENYAKTYNLEKLKEVLKNNDNKTYLNEIIKKYIAYYLFIHIGYYYEDSDDMYANNIIEFSKSASNFKINNFFNSESNHKILEIVKLNNNINRILEVSSIKPKLELLKKNPEYNNAFKYLETLGDEFVKKAFDVKNEDVKAHNMIKTYILNNFYKEIDKKELNLMLESTIDEKDEFIYIDIVLPTRIQIDYSTVESVLSKKEILSGLTHEFWNYILENQNKIIDEQSPEEKILTLINSGIIIPIVEDFMLYHKDSERYDRNMDASQLKKKDDTKIKYVTNKIETMTDLYSDNIKNDRTKSGNIKKLFFTPLNQRKAILINDNEDMKLISKLVNQGKKALESNEYFNDLANFKTYAYMNYKDFDKDGFTFPMTKTVDVVRSVSFESTGDFRQNKSNLIQMRVGSKDQYLNIIGFMIPTNKKPYECIKVKEFKDIHKYGKNGFNLSLSFINEGVVKNNPFESSVYWMFDLNRDTIKTEKYEQNNKLTIQEQIKHIMTKFYDDLLEKVYIEIIEKLDKKENPTIYEAFKVAERVQKRTLKLQKNSELYDKLEEEIYFNKTKKEEEKYDEKEDIFHGMTKDTKKMQNAPNKEKEKIPIIKVDYNKSTEENIMKEIEEVNGICQHNIEWEYVTSLRKTDPNKYSDKLYEFIQNYVIENNVNDYICKSCSIQVDIKKFIIDGTFDDSTNRFVTFSMPFDTPLEEIQEYSKYKITIRSLDKLIEKMAIVANIPFYIGNSFSIRGRRKNVIKDSIDLIISNNNIIRKNLKERKQLASQQYGISSDLSNLWAFELEDSIFIYSSKEKDFYKNIKNNNVMSYLILLMIMDVNESQVTFMSGDKKGLCNFQIFQKYGHVLFDGLKIRINRNGDLEPIKNYRVMCYMIYIMSCMITKYNMWYYDSDEKDKKKKFNPLIQKIVIHTVVDLLNSILESSEAKKESKNKLNYIFEIISTKYFQRLSTMFSSELILKRLGADDLTSVAVDKKTYVIAKTLTHQLTGNFEPLKWEDPKYHTCRNAKFYLRKREVDWGAYPRISNITNCEDGKFHKFKVDGKNLICTLCNVTFDKNDLDKSKLKEIETNFIYNNLSGLAKKYCLSGELHKFNFNSEKKLSVCSNCNKEENYKYSKQELDKLHDNLKAKKAKSTKEFNKEENTKEKTESSEKISKLDFNNFDFIDKFSSLIYHTLGNEGNKELMMRDNMYIIDHNYDGKKFDKPIIISEKENKIIVKPNHPYFKKDVIYYSIYKPGKIEIFYDAITKSLLGYKEASKDYVISTNTDCKIKINYSLPNKIKLLGLDSDFINITSRLSNYVTDFDEFSKLANNDKEDIINTIIVDISRDRINNLKKVIYDLQRFIYRIKNNYVELKKREIKKYKDLTSDDEDEIISDTNEEIAEDDSEESKLDKLVEKYYRKINAINSDKVFDNWSFTTKNIFTQINKDKINIKHDFESKIIDSANILNLDNQGNGLLKYIITELEQLIKINDNKYIKIQLCNALLEFINIIFNYFNTDALYSDYSVKRFSYILKSEIFAEDLEFMISGDGEEEEEDKDKTEEEIEAEEDAREEEEALDIEGEFDYMSNYDRNIEVEVNEEADQRWEPNVNDRDIVLNY